MEMNGYSFNEKKKRIEPDSKKCFYCKDQVITDIEDCYFAPLYKIKSTEKLIMFDSLTYSQLQIGIPRCHTCKNIHSSAQKKSFWISTILAVIILLFSTSPSANLPVWLMISLILVSGIVGFGGYVYLEVKLTKKYNCIPKHYGPRFTPLINDLRKQGWSLVKP